MLQIAGACESARKPTRRTLGARMKLRNWQTACIAAAMNKYQSVDKHFLCLATPAAGKTTMASILADRMMRAGMIDLVICFSPSVTVATDFEDSLGSHLRARMDGLLGSKGQSLTYQSMSFLPDAFWALFDTHKIFVIFDEIHHCAGLSLESANAWGQQIIRRIQGRAAYTLALTGTPWRSDKIPIALSSYLHTGSIHCDFRYGLAQAIRDKVCRVPQITLIDNDLIAVHQGSDTENFHSIRELLENSRCSYQQLIDNDALINYLLQQSSKKLRQVRKQHPDAGGLIVAASVEHAYKIADLLQRHQGITPHIATYAEDDAQGVIQRFRENADPWIISVGMISEGTNIPRLQVCCHLTRVKTELHFRQVLGRILRVCGDADDSGYLFMPAEPSLVEYAQRVAEEIPEANAVRLDVMPSVKIPCPSTLDVSEPDAAPVTLELGFTEPSAKPATAAESITDITPGNSVLAKYYEANIDMFGRFRQELLTLQKLCA